MKKILASVAVCFLMYNNSYACADGDPDGVYFNLFAQEIIQQPEYYPFLLSYESAYYGTDNKNYVTDENIVDWEKYFGNQLNYEDTNALVKVVQLKHLENWKKGILSHQITKKLGKDFYNKYHEGIDYLIKAKEMEPYMFVKYIPNEDAFYYRDRDDKSLNATKLNYVNTLKALQNGYATAKDPEIKLRYAYQIVRFNHYNLKFADAVKAFQTYVAPLNLQSKTIYWNALDQKAGALRGLGKKDEANWDFFQVFMHRRTNKEDVYSSLKLTNKGEFDKLVARAKTPEEKNMAYFLLAYSGFNNPVSIMDKMIANNANSDILKVLTVRAINELERNYLPTTIYCGDNCKTKSNLLPFYHGDDFYADPSQPNYITSLVKTLQNAKAKSDDKDFFDISLAYLKFLQNDYSGSMAILNKINPTNAEYKGQVTKMKMLNDILSQKKMTPEFENTILTKYGDVLRDTKNSKSDANWWRDNSTKDFLLDILANRYFVEHQDAKSFLLNNSLSALQYNPNSELVSKVEAFYRKPNKTAFEKYIAENMDNVGDKDSFFKVIYADRAMRLGEFDKAYALYNDAKKFSGIPRMDSDYDANGNYRNKPYKFPAGDYDGYHNISDLIFGHDKWVSYNSKPTETMAKANTADFPFIKRNMNKAELAQALVELKKIGAGSDDKAKAANTLIGNLMYNTSLLGYYRHVFVMDVNNDNGPKFAFDSSEGQPFRFYYKNFTEANYVQPDNYDIAISYYQKALNMSKNNEEKAQLLYQMAQAQQGKYYQWEAAQKPDFKYDDKDYSAKSDAFDDKLAAIKNAKFRSYFAELKKNYSNTKTAKTLQTNCLYFDYYMKK